MTTKTEISPKRVRAVVGGQVVADSRAARLVWRKGPPVYAFPEPDVRRDLVPDGALSVDAELAGLVFLEWNAVDTWLEEDEQIFAHPRDPHHRVDVLDSSRHVHIEVGGVVVAESRRPRVLFETGLPPRFYLLPADVRLDLLTPTSTKTACPYKGFAQYWTVTTEAETVVDAVWSYPVALPEAAKIAGLLCFYDEKVVSTVDGGRQHGIRR